MKKYSVLFLTLITMNHVRADFIFNNRTGDTIRIDIYYQGESIASCRTDRLTWAPGTIFTPQGRCNIRAIYAWPANDPKNERKMATCGQEILSPISGGLGWFIDITKDNNKYKIMIKQQQPDRPSDGCETQFEGFRKANAKACSEDYYTCKKQFEESKDGKTCKSYSDIQKQSIREMKRCSDIKE